MGPRHELRSCHEDLRRQLEAAVHRRNADGEQDDQLAARLLAHLEVERLLLHPLAHRLVPNGRAVLRVLVEQDDLLAGLTVAGPSFHDTESHEPGRAEPGRAEPARALAAFAAHVGLVDQLVVGIEASGEADALGEVIRVLCSPPPAEATTATD